MNAEDTWTTYHIYHQGGPEDRPVTVEWATNDDDDDGYDDGDVTTLTLYFRTLDDAIKHTGYTRRGYYGQPVDVFLAGEPLLKPQEAKP